MVRTNTLTQQMVQIDRGAEYGNWTVEHQLLDKALFLGLLNVHKPQQFSGYEIVTLCLHQVCDSLDMSVRTLISVPFSIAAIVLSYKRVLNMIL